MQSTSIRLAATAVTLAALLLTLPAWAVHKCPGPNGATIYSDTPCAAGTQGEKLRGLGANSIGPAADRPDHIRAAIAARRPAVGMTEAELVRAIGRPHKINAAQYGNTLSDQLIYYTADRTLYVYTTNGVVRSIQDTDGGQRLIEPVRVDTPAPAQRNCPTEKDIYNIEVEINKLENRQRPAVLAELHRQLGAARACRR